MELISEDFELGATPKNDFIILPCKELLKRNIGNSRIDRTQLIQLIE